MHPCCVGRGVNALTFIYPFSVGKWDTDRVWRGSRMGNILEVGFWGEVVVRVIAPNKNCAMV